MVTLLTCIEYRKLGQEARRSWKESINLDFSHADVADNTVLNKFLWEDRVGATPMPAPNYSVFPPDKASKTAREAHDPD
jgi:hypothetical protein